MNPQSKSIQHKIFQNVMAALTVSFVAISLGAAFGVLSGRGAFAGMISAAGIAAITAALGGTRIQCSGPTGPMTTVMVALFAATAGAISDRFPQLNPDHFINLTLYLMAGLLILAALFRLGRFISLIPNVVISGFMNGIAIIIWLDQIKRLFGWGGKEAFYGPLALNSVVLLTSAGLVFTIPLITRRWMPKFAGLLSGTFLTIVIMTAACSLLQLDIERVSLAAGLKSWSDFTTLLRTQFPTDWSWGLLAAAFPFALQLAVLGYLDTLMTSLVVDKMTGEQTKANQELMAQGVAHAAVATVGGIPGAQATIRSVLMVKEGASWRWAGVLVGILALAEMLIFQDWIKLIPQAVFAGILVKVGYDVFDWLPFTTYLRQLRQRESKRQPAQGNGGLRVTSMELGLIGGTAAVTVLMDLNVAVGLFTAVFYIYNKFISPSRPIPDLKAGTQTELFSDED